MAVSNDATKLYLAKLNIPSAKNADAALAKDGKTLQSDYKNDASTAQKDHDLAQVAADYAVANPTDNFGTFSTYVTGTLGLKDAASDLGSLSKAVNLGNADMGEFVAQYDEIERDQKPTFDKHGNATTPVLGAATPAASPVAPSAAPPAASPAAGG